MQPSIAHSGDVIRDILKALRFIDQAFKVDDRPPRWRASPFHLGIHPLMLTPIIATIGLGSTELLLVLFIALLLVVPFALVPAILGYVLLNRIPAEHRRQEPGLAFLLVIPVFSVVWAFFVYPRIADSLQAYFAARGEHRGDCGRGIALAACICTACSIIPIVGLFSGVAALVLLIVFFVKAFDLTGQIQRPGLTTPTLPITPPAI